MNYWKRSLLLFLTLLLMLTAVAPAFAARDEAASGRVRVVFQNKTGVVTRLVLSGPIAVSLNLGNGKTNYELPRGTYLYAYFACTRFQFGTFKVQKAGVTLKLKCGSK